MQHRIQLSKTLLIAIKGRKKMIAPVTILPAVKSAYTNSASFPVNHQNKYSEVDFREVSMHKAVEELVC